MNCTGLESGTNSSFSSPINGANNRVDDSSHDDSISDTDSVYCNDTGKPCDSCETSDSVKHNSSCTAVAVAVDGDSSSNRR